MDDMSNEARRITFQLNTAYHTPDEVRRLLSGLFGLSGAIVAPGLSTVFIRILVRILPLVRVCLLMPAVIFRIMVV